MSKIVRIKYRQIIQMGVRNLYYDVIAGDEEPVEEILEQFEEQMDILDPVLIDYDIEQTEFLESKVEHVNNHLTPIYKNENT